MRLGFALSGQIGAGKSTLSRHIIDFYSRKDCKCEIVGFSKPLKDLAVKILERPINKATDRLLLQRLGMGMRSEVLGVLGLDSLINFVVKSHPDKALNKGLDRKKYMSTCIALEEYTEENKWGYANHWIDLFDKNLKNLESDILLVEDMRFLNEYEYLCEGLKFVSLRVHVAQDIRRKRILERDGFFNPNMDKDVSESEFRYIPCHYSFRMDLEDGYKEDFKRLGEELFSIGT